MNNEQLFYLDFTKTRYMFEPIDGCAFCCPYCSAFTGSKDIKSWKQWSKPKIKPVYEKQVVKEFTSVNKQPPIKLDFVMVCGTSDAFQSEEAKEVTLKSIDILNNVLHLYTRVLTKGEVPKELCNFPKNQIGITITSITMLDKNIKNGNLKVLETLNQAGIYTIVALQPFDLTTTDEQLHTLLNKLKFIDQLTFGVLNKEPSSNFTRAFTISDIVASFCFENKINFFNGSPRFNKANKKRLAKLEVTTPIWYGDNISLANLG